MVREEVRRDLGDMGGQRTNNGTSAVRIEEQTTEFSRHHYAKSSHTRWPPPKMRALLLAASFPTNYTTYRPARRHTQVSKHNHSPSLDYASLVEQTEERDRKMLGTSQ